LNEKIKIFNYYFRLARERQRARPTQISFLNEISYKRLNQTPRLSDKCTLSNELAYIVGKTEATQSECIKAIWTYIQENGLIVPENKSYFQPDDHLQKIFGNQKVKCFAMSKYLLKHLF